MKFTNSKCYISESCRSLVLTIGYQLKSLRVQSIESLVCWTLQTGVQVLLDITTSHVSCLSREDLNAVQDLLWLFYCQKLINVRNDCDQVGCSVFSADLYITKF